MIRATLFALSAAVILGVSTQAQSPLPVVVPANTSAAAPAGVRAAANADSAGPILAQLEQLKAANEEIIRKQAATLEQLDELVKNAEQLRIFSKRN